MTPSHGVSCSEKKNPSTNPLPTRCCRLPDTSNRIPSGSSLVQDTVPETWTTPALSTVPRGSIVTSTEGGVGRQVGVEYELTGGLAR